MLFESIRSKILRIGNRKFSDGDTGFLFDIGDGPANPFFGVRSNTDTFEASKPIEAPEVSVSGKPVGPRLIPVGSIHIFPLAVARDGFLTMDGSEHDIDDFPELAAYLNGAFNTCTNPLTGVAHPAPAAGKFRVPDWRLAYPRMSGLGASNAAGVSLAPGAFQADSTAKNGLQNSSSTVSGQTGTGSNTGGQSANHTHTFSGTTSGMNANVLHSHPNTIDVRHNSNGFGGGQIALSNGQGVFANTYPTNPANANIEHAHTYSGTTSNPNTDHSHSIPALSVSGTAGAQPITGDVETRPDTVGAVYMIKT